MFKGACRLDDLAHRNIIRILPAQVKNFFCSCVYLHTRPFPSISLG
jgi:hypothetical protein